MASNLYMEFGVLDQGAKRFTGDMGEMTSRLNKLEASLSELNASWLGSSNAAYKDAYDRWHAAAKQLVAYGEEFANNINVCRATMVDCEATNVATIGKANRF